jgi:hypothetical protein
MKPHAIRRSLWFTSLVVGAGFVAAAAHFVLNVRPATAEVLDRGSRTIEQRWRDMAEGYKRAGETALGEANRSQGPVDEATLTSVLLRYAKRNPRWFPFVGPPAPPEKPIGPAITEPKVEAPKGLSAIGKVVLVMDRTMTFEFAGLPKESATRSISVGDYIRANDKEAKRFRLLGLERVPGSVARKVVYEVLDTNGEREGELKSEIVGAIQRDPALENIIGSMRVASGAPVDGAPAVGPDGQPVPVPGVTTEGVAGAGDGGATVVEASGDDDGRRDLLGLDTELTRPVEELTADDLKPRVVQYSDTERAVVFDRNTYEYMRSRGQNVAELVKTEEAVDPGTGRVIGVRVSGFDPQAPVSALDVKRGDILKSINGRPVTSRAQAIEIGQTLREDALVRVVIERAGRDITYVVDPQDPKTRRSVRYFDNVR